MIGFYRTKLLPVRPKRSFLQSLGLVRSIQPAVPTFAVDIANFSPVRKPKIKGKAKAKPVREGRL